MQRQSTHRRQAADLRRNLGYISEQETAGLLGVSVPSFRNRLSAGTAPPHYKVGREKLFRVEEVNAWIMRHRRG